MRLSTSLRIAAVAAAALLIPSLGVTTAAAASGPAGVGPGAAYLESFAGDLSGWTAITGALSEWTVADGTVSIDTRTQAAGRYIRPTAALTLPNGYELRTSVKIDAVDSTGTVTLMTDMRDTTNWRSTGISGQFTGFDATGRGKFQVAAPIASTIVCQGISPVAKSEWVELKVRRAGGITAVYADNQLIGTSASPTAGGTIGLGSYKSKVTFGPISVDPVTTPPADHPTSASGCPWTGATTPTPTPTPTATPTPAPGDGDVTGSGTWKPATASSSDRAGHEVTAGQSSLSLDGSWSFRTDADNIGETAGYAAADASLGGWDTLTVPGNWDTHDRYGSYRGAGWYARDFQTGDVTASAGERAWLRFGAVYQKASVWLNGHRIGNDHIGGYTPFEFDVTDYLVDGTNRLVVRADNTFRQGAWWSWGGISRSVTLVKTGEVTVNRQQILATPDLAAGTAHIESTVFLDNAAAEARTVTVGGTITDADTGAVIATVPSAQVAVPATGSAQTTLAVDLAAGSFALWSVDDPNLYRLNLSLDSPAALDDAAQSDRFGIRLFEIHDDATMTLNGQPLHLAGANRVADDPINGNVEPTALVRRDLDRMKESGLNVSRIMHYPQSPELLDYADEIGMLIIDEVPVWQGGRQLYGSSVTQIQHEFQEQVQRDFNHASIFAHSVANEIASEGSDGMNYVRGMVDFSKSIDPSRFVTFASNRLSWINSPTAEASQYVDFVSINLYDSFTTVPDKVHAMYPTKPIYISEYSPDGYTFGIDRETLDFRTGSGQTAASSFAGKPFVFGWSQWTFNDYRSDYNGTGTNLVRGWGNVDVWGRLKTSFDVTQAANAPVRSLSISGVGADQAGGLGIVTVEPRAATGSNGPTYQLDGYRLSVRAAGADGTVVGGTIVDLPSIAPGSATLSVPVAWRADDEAARVTVALLSPTGYEVAVTAQDVQKPAQPVITETVAASNAVRVRFEDPAGIRSYRVTATNPAGSVAATVNTAETFADLTGLTTGTAYTIRVAAVGSAGASATDDVTVTPTGSLGLPPKVVALVPAVKSLVLGFSDPTASMGWPLTRGGTVPAGTPVAEFDVRVTDHATGAEVQRYQTTNRPGTRVENLTAGVAYDVRIRKLADDQAVTEWSEPLTGTPLSATSAPRLNVQGTIAGATAAGVVLDPTNDTERYRLTISGPGIDRTFSVERSAVDVLPIDGLLPASTYAVTVVAEGVGGDSAAWSGTVTTRPAVTGAAATPPTGLVVTNRGNDAILDWQDAGADGYVVSRTSCGSTTQSTVVDDEFALGKLGQRPGSYTVASVLGSSISAPVGPVTVSGTEQCDVVITPADRTPRVDGSIPFTTTGTWQASSLKGPGGASSVYAEIASSPNATATWTAPAADAVTYRVEVAVPQSASSPTSVRYTVTSADGTASSTVNQVTSGGKWVELGTFTVDRTHPARVTLSNATSGYLRASAARFVVVSPVNLPTAPQPAFAAQRIEPTAPIVGRGTATGNTIVVKAADGTVLAQGNVAADLDWEARGAAPLSAGVYADAVVTETDAHGWIGTAKATVTVTAPEVGVASLAPVALQTEAGQAPVLPASVTATLNDGSTASRAVTWQFIAPSSYATPGTFAVSGAVDGTSVEAVATVTVVQPADGATAAPGSVSLTSNNGWDTGLQDGDFHITMNLWWGQNATSFRLYENGELVSTQSLRAATPAAQSAFVDITGRRNGTYQYVGVLTNSQGETRSSPLTVVVKDANPGVPQLSHDNSDKDGDYIVTANLWWGTNATSYRFVQDGAVVAEGQLVAASPAAQRAELRVTGAAKGDHVYRVEFRNAAGVTTSAPLSTSVTK